MLVLSRQRDETIMIGDDIEITVVDIRGDKVRLGITAPNTVPVHRKEVYEAIKRENREAANVRMEDLPTLPKPPNQGGNLGGNAGPGQEPPNQRSHAPRSGIPLTRPNPPAGNKPQPAPGQPNPDATGRMPNGGRPHPNSGEKKPEQG